MKPGLTISCLAHVGLLGWALIAISAAPLAAPPMETLPVSFISEKDFTQMTQGVKNAEPQKEAKPLADKIGAPKAVDQLAPKAADKPAITTETKPKDQAKPTPKPDPKPDQKQVKAEKPKPPEYKPDQIADLLKKDAAKDKPKQDDDSSRKEAQKSPKFDAKQVAELLDHRDPRRELASAATLNDTVSLGAATGAAAAQLSQSEIDALRSRLAQCWNPPPGIDVHSNVVVSFRVLLRQDGSLAQAPILVRGSVSALGPALADSADRALLSCAPFTMLRPEHYSQWKDMQIDFDPRVMLGG